MKKSITVSAIDLKKENGDIISLTLREAKDLFTQLDKLFGSPAERAVTIPQPIYIERNKPSYWGDQIWCSSDSGEDRVEMQNSGALNVILKG